MGIYAARFRDDPLTVIPDLFRDLPGLFRELIKRPRSTNNHLLHFDFSDPGYTLRDSGTLTCPGTYSKRPRYKNNHRWMFPRSRISVIPGSTRDLRDDGWEYRWGDFGTTDGDKRFAFPGRRLSGYILAPSSRTCSGTLTCSGSLARPGVFGTTDGRGLNRNHLITACGFGVV